VILVVLEGLNLESGQDGLLDAGRGVGKDPGGVGQRVQE
jgi:hypothetical protein